MASSKSSIVTVGLFYTVSEINGDFGRTLQIFPTRVFKAPAELGSSSNFVMAKLE